MTGLAPDVVATWVAAIATLVVLGGLVGERRLFGLAQHLLAGLATGYLGVLALREVIGPGLVAPLIADPGGRPDLWLGLALLGLTAGAAWLPRQIAGVPIALLVGSLAAFALGGAVLGTALPQLHAGIVGPGSGLQVATGLAALAVTALVMIGFLHGIPRGRLLGSATTAGRWLLLAALGGWLGFLLLTRLGLLVDRIGFLLFDWLGMGR